jgi:hypothetical protein
VNNQGDKNNTKNGNDDAGLAPAYSELYQGLLSKGLPIAGSGSVAVETLMIERSAVVDSTNTANPDGINLNTINLNTSQLNLSALDTTRLVNTSGGFTIGKRESTTTNQNDAQASPPGLGTLAGAASVNLVSRQVTTELKSVNLADTATTVSLSSATDEGSRNAYALAGAMCPRAPPWRSPLPWPSTSMPTGAAPPPPR